MEYQPPRDLDPQISNLIKHKVRKLVGHYGFRRQDEDDLRQELSLQVIKGLRRHDPARATIATFADRIVRSKIATIIERATAQKRDRRRERCLDEHLQRDLVCRCVPVEQVDLIADVHAALLRLPMDLRPIANLFMQHRESEVIRRTGLSRQRVRTIRGRIRRHLLDHGIGREFIRTRSTRRRCASVDIQLTGNTPG